MTFLMFVIRTRVMKGITKAIPFPFLKSFNFYVN